MAHDLQPRPFTVDVGEEVLDDLRERLRRTRWPEQVPGVGWDHGADLSVVRRLCEHWATAYDWRAAEARLNAHPQVLVAIDGVDVHALHVRGQGPAPVPVLMVHGWPGSVWEFMDVIGPLTDPASYGGDPADAVDLVVPSLPGFGFSSAPRERGWSATRIADALDTLMRGLGYDGYVAQGGDWGANVSSLLGARHPETCRALHVTMPLASPPADPSPETERWVAAMKDFGERERGYSAVQSTKPDSLTLAQHDSPAGLAAWVLEKFHGWSDLGGRDLLDVYVVDDLCSNLMLYWATGATPSAARIYLESRNDPTDRARPPVTVPTGVAHFPAEPFAAPREVSETRYPIDTWTEMDAGGHFAAMEAPDALVTDLRAFLRRHRERVLA
ncbi:epoxide hydrolase family protein [Nocardioides sp. CFH 31398]|uniref:epoxide hydrolase family protein n=1 Tax=Nocardioides sp. CFH 31398 TaxID=2919579 RepID=UPI001F06EC11|nr:epoxide hydrolase family protein [Nocardioides sp. CFH 31398]MCH1867000.1 epoxide hydrolase [Nocardioides sp. CFH 31398]